MVFILRRSPGDARNQGISSCGNDLIDTMSLHFVCVCVCVWGGGGGGGGEIIF